MPARAPLTQEQSHLIFNNSYMFTVLVEIVRSGDTFSGKQLADATGLSQSIVHPLIRKLSGARFIEFVERVPGERTLLYRIRDNYWWDAVREYAVDGEGSPPAVTAATG